MKYYLAPMEGITTYIFRNAYHAYFRPMDKYFTPFIVPHKNKDFNFKEKNEILPEHNEGQNLVPQILTNCGEDFLRTSEALKEYGYKEVNLNLGCPSGTVVSKKRGSGFLADPERLDCFFEEVFSQTDLKVSVKTRIGLNSPDEFETLLELFNKYPLEELIIHPRIQKDLYKNHPNREVFATAAKKSRSGFQEFINEFPHTERVMLGRGILRNPSLIEEIEQHNRLDKNRLRDFHDRIYLGYQEIMSGERNVIFRMKELWSYLAHSFENSEKVWKKIKKAQTAKSYEAAVEQIFRSELR